MEFHVVSEPNIGATYQDLLLAALAVEEAGFAGFFRSDHLMNLGRTSGEPGPTDAWISLAGLARDTRRIRLGTLVSPVTFRHPGTLAIAVAQVDTMSGGRVELGLGAGWSEREHEAYGLPFPDLSTRLSLLSEQLQIITGLWTTPRGQHFSYRGEYHQLSDSPALPKPAQVPHPPIILGGRGGPRSLRLAADHATEYNVAWRSLAESAAIFDSLDSVVHASGMRRVRRSVSQFVCVGRSEDEATGLAEELGFDVPGLKASGMLGTAERVADALRAFEQLGVERIYLAFPDVRRLDVVDRWQELLPQFDTAQVDPSSEEPPARLNGSL